MHSQEATPPPYSFWLGAMVLRGSVLPRVLRDVIIFGVLAAIVVVVAVSAERRFNVSLAAPVGPFEAAGAILGLLLVLRTNAGYERWWEGRKLWGGIVNQSRNLGIMGLAYGPKNEKWREEFIHWAAAYPHSVRRSLRDERDMPELSRLIGEENVRTISETNHMPDAVSKRLADLLHDARASGMDAFAFQQTERQRGILIDHLGGCERILKTPLALSGAIQVRRFILLFLIALPFALLRHFEPSGISDQLTGVVWVIPVFVMLMAYPLLSLDRIGMELQNPFATDHLDFLPLDSICVTIERNLLELLEADPKTGNNRLSPEAAKLPPDASHPATRITLDSDIS